MARRRNRSGTPWTITGKVVHMRRHSPGSRQADREEGAPPRPPEGFVAQGVNFARRFTRARLTRPEDTPVSEIAPGQARVIGVDGARVAVYRDDAGGLHSVSAVCTHLGCVIDWNGAARTWDCPCHGSRFDFDGHVIRGPAQRDLEPAEVEAAAHA
jgi:Rieske Fe-S protein